MATEMFKNYDNIPADYIPDNRFPCGFICGEGPNVIVRGTTPLQSFELPYDLVKSHGLRNGDVLLIRITYKQSLTTVIEKTENEVQFVDNELDHKCLLYFTMTEEETRKFEVTNANNVVNVQVKVMLTQGDVLVTEMYHMEVLDSLCKENLEETKNG